MRNAMKWCVSCDGRKAFAALIAQAVRSSRMATKLRQGIADRQEPVVLEGEVECDEVYVVAGHKGHPAAVQKKGEKAAAAV